MMQPDRPQDPTAGLLFVPDGPRKTPRRRRSKPRPVLVYKKPEQPEEVVQSEASASKAHLEELRRAAEEAAREPEVMTLAEAFELGDSQDDERALRSAALLLEWSSDVGNKEVDGFLAMGISRTLYLAAEDMSRELRRRDLKLKHFTAVTTAAD